MPLVARTNPSCEHGRPLRSRACAGVVTRVSSEKTSDAIEPSAKSLFRFISTFHFRGRWCPTYPER